MGEVDGDVRLGSKRLQDDVAPVTRFGLLLRHLTGLNQSLHQRLILRELLRAAISHQIGPTVAHLRHVKCIAEQSRNGGGGPHPAMLGVLLGEVVDTGVGLDGRVPQRGRKRLRRWTFEPFPLLAQHGEYDVGCHAAGEFARRGTTHAVGNKKQQAVGGGSHVACIRLESHRFTRLKVGHEERVLVVLTRSPYVGQREHTRDDARVTVGRRLLGMRSGNGHRFMRRIMGEPRRVRSLRNDRSSGFEAIQRLRSRSDLATHQLKMVQKRQFGQISRWTARVMRVSLQPCFFDTDRVTGTRPLGNMQGNCMALSVP